MIAIYHLVLAVAMILVGVDQAVQGFRKLGEYPTSEATEESGIGSQPELQPMRPFSIAEPISKPIEAAVQTSKEEEATHEAASKQ